MLAFYTLPHNIMFPDYCLEIPHNSLWGGGVCRWGKVVGWYEGVLYLTSPGSPTDVGL